MDDPDHFGSFAHYTECVKPWDSIANPSPTFSTFPIPVPTNNTVVLGYSQPESSFDAHPASDRVFSLWNGTITSAVYDVQGSLTASQSATSMIVCFTADAPTAVLAWGGHIASRLEWGVGNSAGNISGSPYHMRVLGSKCCSATSFSGGNQDRSLQAGAVSPAPIAIIAGLDSSCVGNVNTHTLSVNQTGTITYQWAITAAGTTGAQFVGSDTTQSVQVSTSAAGTYIICGTVTVNGTSDSDCDTITVLPLPTCNITGNSLVCNGGSTTFTASGGDSYLWSTGETTASIQVSQSGTYTVTVYDAFGCSSSCSKTLTIGAPFTLDFVVTDVLCHGESTGSVNLSILNGSGIYTYAWSNGASSEDLSNVPSGTYTVTVTDENGCTLSGSATVDEPAAALALSETHTDVSCNGGNDGTIDLSVTGGTPPYGYSWSDGSFMEDNSGLTAGNYNVIVTDYFGCSASLPVTIAEPSALSISESHQNVACNGGNNGTIDITVSGGTPGYSFLWNDNATTEDRTNLSSGTYTVVVTDANGCTEEKTVFISQAGSLVVNETHTNVSCNNGSNGSIDLTVSGGTPGYSYLWNDNDTGEDRTALSAGPIR